MERVSRFIRKLSFPADSVSAGELAVAAWPVAVGKRIALHARAASLVRTKLIVEVEDAVWQRQLFHMSRQIVSKLNESLGSEVIEEIEFRIGIPRRGPQRAQQIASRDEADQISDPVMR